MNAAAFTSGITGAMHWAWTTSVIVALPALLLLLLGRAHRFPSAVRWLIGAALLVRLLLPSVPQLPGMDVLPAPKLEHTPIVSNVSSAALSGSTTIEPDRMPIMVVPEFRIASALPWLWLSGCGIVGLWVLCSHLAIRRRVTLSAASCEDEDLLRLLNWAAKSMGIKAVPALLMMRGLPTAALSGWLRPRILVPDDFRNRFNDDEVRAIFLHEIAHVKRHDVLWSWLSLAACGLHWFNPFAWLVARRFCADRELECDRLALGRLDADQRHHFGEALLKTLEGQQWSASPALVSFAQYQPEIRTRILMIVRPLSPLWIRCLSLLAAPGLILLTLNNASADGEKEPSKARDGEGAKKPGARDGEGQPRTGARDGEGAKKPGARDGEGQPRTGARDGEGAKKPGARDGEGQPRTGARDGEGGKKAGPRDGEGSRKTGSRESEGSKKAGARDGEGMKKGASDAQGGKKPAGNADKAVVGNPLIIRAVEKGESVLVDGQKVDAQRLRARLSEFLPEQKGRPVVIEADDDVPYKTVMEVLDAARDNGAKKATLRTTKG